MDGSVNELQSMLAALDCANSSNESMVDWSDNYFRVHFMENNKLSGRLQLYETCEYVKAFLNWYVSGKGGGKLLDLWIGVVSSMLVPTESVSCEYFLMDSMFRGKIGEAKKLDPLEDVTKLKDFIYANEGPEFSSSEAKTWYYSIFSMLDKNQKNLNSVPASMIVAVNYMGYIALSLLKILIKEGPKISHHIIKNVTNEFNGFWRSSNLSIKTRTPPPHKYAVQQFKHVFQKTSPNCIRVLTLIVATHVYTNSFYRTEIQNVLKTACLDFMDLYGMGCFYWLQKASKECSISIEKLIDLMSTNTNRETNQALKFVLNNYAYPGSNQHTWRWARLFVDKAFVNISISKNPNYAATMAALSCKGDTESPVWKISQFRNENLKKDAIRMARIILNTVDCDVLNQCSKEASINKKDKTS